MKKLAIDFAPSSTRAAVARLHPLAWVASAAAIAAIIQAAIVWSSMRQQEQLIAHDMERARARLAGQAARKSMPLPTLAQPQAAAVNGAIAQLNLPWRDLFDAVEAATPPTIALMALEPDAGKHLIKGTAEARNSEAMLAYVEALKRQSFLATVTLTRHEINAQDPNRPFRFQFEAQWEGQP